MTPEIVKAKTIIAKHYSNGKPEPVKPYKKIPMLSAEKHLFNFLKNHYEKDKTKGHKHSALIGFLNGMPKSKSAI